MITLRFCCDHPKRLVSSTTVVNSVIRQAFIQPSLSFEIVPTACLTSDRSIDQKSVLSLHPLRPWHLVRIFLLRSEMCWYGPMWALNHEWAWSKAHDSPFPDGASGLQRWGCIPGFRRQSVLLSFRHPRSIQPRSRWRNPGTTRPRESRAYWDPQGNLPCDCDRWRCGQSSRQPGLPDSVGTPTDARVRRSAKSCG